ncbi:MAG: ribosome-associated translation inhibitor RaiA [Thermoanaerobaculia bacterium]|nr:ribosome-associated translation inhibitor RaiA [Thermoanaerobaculia bacterium]MCZ7650823.1 ribosome-associated translation inhibitor RaiA [Thermoanaerobaculia bacterium]
MKVDFVARNFELDDQVRTHVQERLTKVAKFLKGPVEARAALELEKFRYSCDLVLTHRGGEVRAAEENHDLRQAIDIAAEALEKQVRRSRKKVVDQRRRAGRGGASHWPVEVVARGSLGGGEEPRVVRKERLPIKPMTLEEAALQLDTAEHDFVVFRDAASDKVSVLYRQKDDENLGLIAPEF